MSTIQHNIKRSDKRERYSNLEFLRIIATLFVVIIHFNHEKGGQGFLYTNELPINHQILLFFEMLAICAVNIFVMISGYFLCTSMRVSIWKILRLYIDVIIISLLRYFLSCLLGDRTFTLRGLGEQFIPLNWYVAVYSGLYLISPYLNQIFKNINRSQFRFMLLIFFFVLSLWPSGIEFLSKVLDFSPNSLSPISNQGSGDGYTLVNFILMYFLGAYFRLHKCESIHTKKSICALLIFISCTIVNIFYANIFFGRATSYCNPFVVIQTVAIFVAFQNMRIQSKVINTIASCSFGVYLMHSFFYRFCQIERFVTGNPLIVPLHLIVSLILIYTVSGIIYWCYQKALAPVFTLLQTKLRILSYEVN